MTKGVTPAVLVVVGSVEAAAEPAAEPAAEDTAEAVAVAVGTLPSTLPYRSYPVANVLLLVTLKESTPRTSMCVKD